MSKKIVEIPIEKQGMTIGEYIQQATFEELCVLFASYIWTELEFETVMLKEENELNKAKWLLQHEMPKFLEYKDKEEF